MRKLTICLALCLALLTCGCANVQLKCGIDPDFTATLTYKLTLDTRGVNMAEWPDYEDTIQSILARQEQAGFATTCDIDADTTTVTLTQSKKAGSYAKALDNLVEMMSGPTSPFSAVAGNDKKTDAEWLAKLAATVDFSGVFLPENLEDMPQRAREQLEQGLGNATGKLTLSLPSSDGEGIVTTTVPFGLQEPAEAKLETRVHLDDDGRAMDEPFDTIAAANRAEWEKWNRYTLIGFCAAGTMLLAVCATFVLTRKKKAKVSME